MKQGIEKLGIAAAALFAGLVAVPVAASEDLAPALGAGMSDGADRTMAAGLILPRMDAAEGRRLFASKGCVVCHSIGGIGGEDAPPLDAEFMDLPMNPFDFAARMWRGAGAMVALQEDELGGQIELDGQELAAIIAFVHDGEEQKLFSEADIPSDIDAMMHAAEEDEHGEDGMDEGGMGGGQN